MGATDVSDAMRSRGVYNRLGPIDESADDKGREAGGVCSIGPSLGLLASILDEAELRGGWYADGGARLLGVLLVLSMFARRCTVGCIASRGSQLRRVSLLARPSELLLSLEVDVTSGVSRRPMSSSMLILRR